MKREQALATVQRCVRCHSHRIAPVVDMPHHYLDKCGDCGHHTIIYRCLDCSTVVDEPTEV
jgi:predicted RNA-binding Zn-ribbon protein involved in translation (DUF1610 family)